MGYVSLGAYDGTLRVPEFKGLMQYGDTIGGDPRYAVEAVNASTKDGVLSPLPKCIKLPASLPAPIETLALLHRRYYVEPSEQDVLIACASGQLYWSLPDVGSWTKIPMPAEYIGDEYKSSRWSYVTYEVNLDGGDAPVDVLLMSNAYDGMICVYGNDLSAAVVNTPQKFGVIARSAERIWGGGIIGEPDMLVYSAPYDPFDWQQNDEIPEDGAGDVLQPSWDGDSFVTLAPFGSQLIAFKKNTVWRVLGTNPGEYTFKEQYGGGTPYADTVATNIYRMFMLGDNGLLQYDGESVKPFGHEYTQQLFAKVRNAQSAVACMHNGVYYCALPLDGSKTNNCVLMYDTEAKTFLLRDDVNVEHFCIVGDRLLFTDTATPGFVWEWSKTGEAARFRWVSPWQDFSSKNMTKGSFTVYLTVECAYPAELEISVQTEKKTKTKKLTFQPPAEGKGAKQRRIVFGGNGRRFRFIIESKGTTPWRLLGGLQLEAETDTD